MQALHFPASDASQFSVSVLNALVRQPVVSTLLLAASAQLAHQDSCSGAVLIIGKTFPKCDVSAGKLNQAVSLCIG